MNENAFSVHVLIGKNVVYSGILSNRLLRKMPCISVRHVEAPKLTEIDFSPNVRVLSICLRLLSFKGFISQRKNYVLSAICLHAF